MPRFNRHDESHKSLRIGWLRAAVLGANDGIVSTSSLIVGVAAASAGRHDVLLSGVAGLVAGAMSMAAGEYVSVSSQADTEQADLAREKSELAADPEFEHEELAQIYVERGLQPSLARQVAEQLMAFDALKSHARDELGITDEGAARPLQAAFASGLTFSIGAALPLAVVVLCPFDSLKYWVPGFSLLFLMGLGMMASRVGGARPWRGAIRVGFWSSVAMLATALIGKIFGTVVS